MQQYFKLKLTESPSAVSFSKRFGLSILSEVGQKTAIDHEGHNNQCRVLGKHQCRHQSDPWHWDGQTVSSLHLPPWICWFHSDQRTLYCSANFLKQTVQVYGNSRGLPFRVLTATILLKVDCTPIPSVSASWALYTIPNSPACRTWLAMRISVNRSYYKMFNGIDYIHNSWMYVYCRVEDVCHREASMLMCYLGQHIPTA